MKKERLSRIIRIIREGMSTAGVGPTNRTGESVANFSPVINFKKRKKSIGVWSRSLRKNSASK